MFSCLQLMNSAGQIYAQKEDGIACNILQPNSGTDGEKISPDPPISTEMEEQSLKFQNWRFCILKG